MTQAPRVTNPRRLAIVGVLALAVILVVLFSARDVIREVVVLPLSYVFWFIRVFVDTTPQIFFWAAVLLIAGLIAFRSLVGGGKILAEVPPDLDDEGYGRVLSGQVSFWASKVNLLRQGQSKYFQNSFHHTVGRLLMETLAYRYHLTQRQIEEQLQDGTLNVPADVRSYALSNINRQEIVQSRVWSRYWSALVDLFRSWFAPQAGSFAGAAGGYSRDEQQVLAVLKYIEDELEVPHDDSGR